MRIITASLGLALCLLSSCGKVVSTEEETTNMSKVRFFNYADFTLPEAPGDASSLVSLDFTGRTHFGVVYPYYQSPSSTEISAGCSTEGGLRLLGYQYQFIGAPGLLPGIVSGLYAMNYLPVSFGRQISTTGFSQMIVPFMDSDLHDVEMDFRISSSLTALKAPIVDLASISWTIDTSNVQDVYYGASVRLLIFLDVECVWGTT